MTDERRFVPVPDALAQTADKLIAPSEAAAGADVRATSTGRPAAVLILFCPGTDGLDLILVEKRADLRHHAGQLAFPGGGIEADDADPVQAALREAEEEVGVPGGEVSVLGILPAAQIRRTGFEVTPVVGWWHYPRPIEVVDLGELADVHRVPVSSLLDPAARDTWQHARGFTGPGFWIDDLYVWGFTAYLLDRLFTLLDWTLPWDETRISSIPARFLSERP